MPNHQTTQGTLLGFDFGKLRIGVAVGETVTGTARALTCLRCTAPFEPPWPTILALSAEWHPVRLVVGLPEHLDGRESPLGTAARRFADQLGARTALPVSLWGEALSTEAARDTLAEHRRQGARAADRNRLNAQAASEILGGWLMDASHD